MKIFQNRIIKIIGWSLGGLIAAFVVLVLVTAFRSWWSGYQWQKKADKFQAALEKPYREDTFGGKTPEETWQMFLSALKQGDVEQASKYVAVDKKGEYQKDLEKAKQEGTLEQWTREMGTLKKDPKSDKIGRKLYYSYTYFDKKSGKNLGVPVVFYLNPYTKVWKILVL